MDLHHNTGMKRPTHAFRSFATCALASLAAISSLAQAQTSPVFANQEADADAQVAQAVEEEILRIDPTTGKDSLVVDPSLPQPYGITVEPLALEPFEPGLPPLVEQPTGTGAAPVRTVDPLAVRRASRMIDDPQVEEAFPPVTTYQAPKQEPVFDAPVQAPPMVANPIVQDLPPEPKIAVTPQVRVSNDPFVIKSILPIEGAIRYGDWFWDDSRAPANGKIVITVDLDARVISVFRDGHEIGTAVALLGTQTHPTPLGTFPILTKEKDNVSEKYNNAPMPWTLRLTWDGIAIHGSPVINGYASHGCVGVPNPFAEKLYSIAKRGDKVVITRGKFVGMGDKLL